MKKQVLLTIATTLILGLGSLSAQQIISFDAVKKNGLYIEPLAVFGKNKEARLGYERMLSRNVALNIGLGAGLNNEDPGLETIDKEYFHHSFTRTGKSELSWLLIIPIWNTTYSAPTPQETENVQTSRYLKSHYFSTAEMKFFLTSNLQRKVPNGLYLAPGVQGGRTTHALYENTTGSRNQIEVYDASSNTWGIPFLIGSSNSTWTERVTVYKYESRTAATEVKHYLRPYMRLGYQLPLGDHFSIDLSGQVFVKEKEQTSFDDPFATFSPNFGRRNLFKRMGSTAAVRVSCWF